MPDRFQKLADRIMDAIRGEGDDYTESVLRDTDVRAFIIALAETTELQPDEAEKRYAQLWQNRDADFVVSRACKRLLNHAATSPEDRTIIGRVKFIQDEM